MSFRQAAVFPDSPQFFVDQTAAPPRPHQPYTYHFGMVYTTYLWWFWGVVYYCYTLIILYPSEGQLSLTMDRLFLAISCPLPSRMLAETQVPSLQKQEKHLGTPKKLQIHLLVGGVKLFQKYVSSTGIDIRPKKAWTWQHPSPSPIDAIRKPSEFHKKQLLRSKNQKNRLLLVS